MPTVKQHLKQSLTLILFIATFSGYNHVFAETTETVKADAHATKNNIWSGVYHGFIPCDDCKGVKMTLALNKNNSYLLISQYVGKSEKEIVEKGKFTEGNESNTIVLTPRNSSQTRHYLIGENILTQLDSNGTRITGKSAERYILRRKEISETQNQPSHH